MNNLQWMASLSAVTLLLASCGAKQQAQTPATQAPVAQSLARPMLPAKPAAPKPVSQTVAVPGLFPATNPQTQVSKVITPGKRDPFAALLPLPGDLRAVVTKSALPAALPNQSGNQSSPIDRNAQRSSKIRTTVSSPSLPLNGPLALPPLTPLSNTLPIVPVEQLPTPVPMSPASLADAIEVTGVMQMTGRLVAIIKAPDETSARYVQPGEYISGGQVLLKQIVISKNGEPKVILQQNGIEVMKSIGARSTIASTR